MSTRWTIDKILGGDFKGCHVLRLYHRPVMEDMFEVVTHAACFEDEADAHRLKDRIMAKAKAARGGKGWAPPFEVINLDHWMWQASKGSCYGRLQEPPLAKPFRVPAEEYLIEERDG